MKTVIEMAREAQMPFYWRTGEITYLDKLERFAQLVRADEREAMMQLFTDPENQPTQHDTVTVQYMLREIAAEREACANAMAYLVMTPTLTHGALVKLSDVVNAIRVRGTHET